jgi:hypothetical protein
MSAFETATDDLCPPELFEALCDWLAEPGEIVHGTTMAYRHSPNTRARAFRYWRFLWAMEAERRFTE